jgi:hypothetical protein
MKTFTKCAAQILLAAVVGSTTCLAQTAPAQPVPATTRPAPHRFSGKVTTIDPKAKIVTIQPDKLLIAVTDTTKIIKLKVAAKFGDLAVGDTITGFDHKDASGNWVADSLNVGQARQVLDAPAPKTFVAPPPKPATNAPAPPTKPN